MELATPPQNAHLRGERQGRCDVMTIIKDMMAMMVNIIINIKLISSRGSCASSFGVCCVFSLACGSTSSEVGNRYISSEMVHQPAFDQMTTETF